MKQTMTKMIEVPDGVTVQVDDAIVVNGPQGENRKVLRHPKITIAVKDKSIEIQAENATRREKKLLGTFAAIIRNMLTGARELFTYTLKVCSGHFPMNVTVSGNELIVKNFLGESVPRKLSLKPGVNVTVNGNEITVQSSSKEAAGQTAADIEQLCRITTRDRRVFQDGIYIISKPK
jgi:large subunit ribosomal protein L6